MLAKPLPIKMQHKGKRIGMILSLVFAFIFAGSLASFIGFNVTTPKDISININGGYATSIKPAGEGIIYSTSNNFLNYTVDDFNEEKDLKVDVKNLVSSKFSSLGELSSISSINYGEKTGNIYLTGSFYNKETTLTTTYLFKFNISANSFVIDNNYVEVPNAFTTFTEDDAGHNLYAVIRKNTNCGVYKFDYDDLSKGILGQGYYYRLINKNYDDEGEPLDVEYHILSNPMVCSINYYNDLLYTVLGNSVITMDPTDFALNSEPTYENRVVKKEDFDFNKYCFFLYTSSNNNATGAVLIGNKYYCSTNKSMMTFNIDNLELCIAAEVYERSIDITFGAGAPSTRNALFYNSTTKTAVFITALENYITYIDMSDLDHINIKFADEADINISDVIITNTTGKIFYLFQNAEKADASSHLLSYKLIEAVNYKFVCGRVTTALLPTFIVAFIIALICFFIWLKPLFLEKFLLFVRNLKQNFVAYIVLAVCLTLLGLFCYYPAVGSITMSFFKYETNQPVVWNNFNNYVKIFTDSEVWKAFGNMAIFLVTDIVTALIPPLLFAFFLTVMKNKKISAVARTLLFLPSVIPGLTKLMIWQNGIYGDNGVINLFTKICNGEHIYFFNGSGADIWWLVLMGFPYVGSYLVFYGALMNIPSSYYEAAELEGLNVWKRFVRIDIPLIKPQLKYVLILTIIASVQNFGRTYMINSAYVTKTPIHIMYDYITNGQYGMSSAIAAILFILLFFATLFNMRKQKEQLGDSI